MFIDVHGHAYRRAYPAMNGKSTFSTPEELIERYKQLNIHQACLLPVVSPEIYLPQSNEEILEICQKYPEHFIPFCNIDPRAVTNSWDAPLGYLLSYYRDQGCRGVGEVMPNLAFLDPLMQNLFKHVQDAGLPLIFDLTNQKNFYGLYDDPGLPQLEMCLRRFPRLIFLGHGPGFWAEISQLETTADRCSFPDYPVIKEGAVSKLMRRYLNLYCDLSANSGYNAFRRDPEYAVGFFNEFQDRLLFGTDICCPDQPAPLAEFLLNLQRTNKISETVFKKIACDNARKLLKL